MKRSQMKTLLLIEGAVCLTLTLALRLIEGAAFSFAAFPGSAAGQGLSMLAGTGRFGFALALTLYAFLALLPLYALARIRARRDWKAEDTLLGLCSLAVAGALFPRGWVTYWSTSAETLFPRLAWQWLLFALLAGWVVLRLLRRFSDGGTQELLKLFRVLLGLAAAYFVFAVFFVEFAGLLTAIDTLKAGNTAFTADTLLPVAGNITGSKSLAFSYIVLALRFGAKSLPTLFAAATAYFAIGLLDTMEDGAFTQESAAYAPKLAAWCVKVLKLSVLLALAVNLLQAVCAPLILSTSISIPLPVLELCFVLAALLGARLIASNVALAADNDLFI
ncbi:MAG: hypothetical protein SPE62_02540 [Oscillospiraceae bacterium]|nr:hypothetical protein [Oscillospiraceae bacterium]